MSPNPCTRDITDKILSLDTLGKNAHSSHWDARYFFPIVREHSPSQELLNLEGSLEIIYFTHYCCLTTENCNIFSPLLWLNLKPFMVNILGRASSSCLPQERAKTKDCGVHSAQAVTLKSMASLCNLPCFFPPLLGTSVSPHPYLMSHIQSSLSKTHALERRVLSFQSRRLTKLFQIPKKWKQRRKLRQHDDIWVCKSPTLVRLHHLGNCYNSGKSHYLV